MSDLDNQMHFYTIEQFQDNYGAFLNKLRELTSPIDKIDLSNILISTIYLKKFDLVVDDNTYTVNIHLEYHPL